MTKNKLVKTLETIAVSNVWLGGLNGGRECWRDTAMIEQQIFDSDIGVTKMSL